MSVTSDVAPGATAAAPTGPPSVAKQAEEAGSAAWVPELDGLRGCAIGIVLLFHFANDLPHNIILFLPVNFGWAGVDLFFVLSGFLITRILLRTRERSDYFRAFYLRRALRIFPVYYWSLIVILLLFGAIPSLRSLLPAPHDRIFHWLYLSNWIPFLLTADQGTFGHFWSLAVEEQFYWIWPLAVWKINPRKLPYFAAAAALLAFLLRVYLYNPDGEPLVYRNTFCRMDALMFGGLCAMAMNSPRFRHWLAANGKALIVPMLALLAGAIAGDVLWHHPFTYKLGFSMFALSFALLLLYAMHGPVAVKEFFRSRPLRLLGRYSYGIYVYHQIIYCALDRTNLVAHGFPMLAVCLVSSLLLAAASYELAEKRILALKERFSHDSPAVPQPVEAPLANAAKSAS
jgi:peptidoglycan/LPS O-acetylase OafA/YrhL